MFVTVSKQNLAGKKKKEKKETPEIVLRLSEFGQYDASTRSLSAFYSRWIIRPRTALPG